MGWTGQTTLSFLAPYRGFGIRAECEGIPRSCALSRPAPTSGEGARSLELGHWLSNPEAPRRRPGPLRRTAAKHRAGAPQLAE
jgi:hypothetical protein